MRADQVTNAQRAQGDKHSRVILPTAWWMGYWDATTGVALVFTALFTPYEVAILKTRVNGLFFVNQAINLVFVVDIRNEQDVVALKSEAILEELLVNRLLFVASQEIIDKVELPAMQPPLENAGKLLMDSLHGAFYHHREMLYARRSLACEQHCMKCPRQRRGRG